MYNPKVTACNPCNPVKRAVREAMFEYNTQLLNKVALAKLDKLQGVCKELDIESCPKVKIIIADMEVTIQPSDTALKALLADVRKQVNDADKFKSNEMPIDDPDAPFKY